MMHTFKEILELAKNPNQTYLVVRSIDIMDISIDVQKILNLNLGWRIENDVKIGASKSGNPLYVQTMVRNKKFIDLKLQEYELSLDQSISNITGNDIKPKENSEDSARE